MTTQKSQFGESVELSDGYEVWWSYISHFIHTPGYVTPTPSVNYWCLRCIRSICRARRASRISISSFSRQGAPSVRKNCSPPSASTSQSNLLAQRPVVYRQLPGAGRGAGEASLGFRLWVLGFRFRVSGFDLVVRLALSEGACCCLCQP